MRNELKTIGCICALAAVIPEPVESNETNGQMQAVENAVRAVEEVLIPKSPHGHEENESPNPRNIVETNVAVQSNILSAYGSSVSASF